MVEPRRPSTSANVVSYFPGNDVCCFCGTQVSAEQGHTPAFFGPQANMLCHRSCLESHNAESAVKPTLTPVPSDNEISATITVETPGVEPYRRALQDIAAILRRMGF